MAGFLVFNAIYNKNIWLSDYLYDIIKMLIKKLPYFDMQNSLNKGVSLWRIKRIF